MKFKIIASLVVIVAIFATVILGGGLNIGSSSSNTQTNNDGIRINP